MDSLQRRFRNVHHRFKPNVFEASTPAEADVFNKHLCNVCIPALNYLRGVPVANSEFLTFTDRKSPSVLQYQYNKHTLWDSVEEGCHFCTGIRDTLLRQGQLADRCAEDLRLSSFCFFNDGGQDIDACRWTVVETHNEFVSNADYHKTFFGRLFVHRKPIDFDRSVSSVFPLDISRRTSCSSDILLDYQPVADMMTTPLWELIKQWMERCCSGHQCSHDATMNSAAFPRRLVELSTIGSGLKARLVETTIPGFIRGPYLTLSHSWGSDKFLTLTSSNIDDFYTEIPLDDLRYIFTDAFIITRRLGFRYIWIDSLCIIQDNLDDWRYESAHMGDIYRGSTCNIAASVDGVGSSTLFERPCRVEDIIPLRFTDLRSGEECRCFMLDELFERIDKHPLNKRGWVLQERLLSPRGIYFGTHQVLWECTEAIAWEAFPEGISSDFQKYDTMASIKTWRAKAERSIRTSSDSDGAELLYDREKAFDLWCFIVEMYCRTNLTKEKDKLVALSGIAKEIQKYLQDEYLAGLWKRYMIRGLLWGVEKLQKYGQRPQRYRAPSWSWASIDGSICHDFYVFDGYLELAEIRETYTEPLAGDLTGEIKGGHIKVCGVLRNVAGRPQNTLTTSASKALKAFSYPASLILLRTTTSMRFIVSC